MYLLPRSKRPTQRAQDIRRRSVTACARIGRQRRLWTRHETAATEAVTAVYDSYLKYNGKSSA
jgi:hypothetical protein